MEVNSNSEQNTTNSTVNEQGIGEFLRQQRERQQRSLADVAKELHISEKQLIALESDNFKVLPEAPFLKGHYRNYAQLLNVDIATMLNHFDSMYKQATGHGATHELVNSPIKEMGRLASSNKNRSKWIKRTVIAVVLFVVVALLGSAISNMMNKKKIANANNEQVIEFTPTQGTQSVASYSGNGDKLHLEFINPTSVRIVDATGQILAQGRQANTLDLTGKAPFDIRIDDAKSVKLKLNNEEINLSSHTKSSGSAEFKLAQ